MTRKPTNQELQARCRVLEKELADYRAEREDLLERERQYRLIAENTSDLVSMLTFDETPLFTYISPSFQTVGYHPEDLAGKPALSFVHAEDRSHLAGLLKNAIREKAWEGPDGSARQFVNKLECRFQTPEGGWLYFESSVTNIGCTALLLISRDIGEKKETEKALLASEKAYRSIFENTGTATLIIEADTTIGMANSQFARLVGYARAEIEGRKKWTEFVVPEDLDFMKAYHYERRMGGKEVPRTYEFRLLDRYGNERWVHNTVALIPGTGQSVASMHDLTDIRRAEAALRESEEKFRIITANAHDGIVMVDSGGVVTYCNRAVESIFGYSSMELIGRRMKELFKDRRLYLEVNDLFRETMTPAVESEPAGPVRELTARRKDGHEVRIELAISTVSIRGERHALGIIRDISERARVAQRLRQAEKMEAIGTLAAGIAHDFNNVLSGIFAYSQLARRHSEQNPKVRAYIGEIHNASQRAKKLVQHIMTFSRQRHAEKEIVEIDPLINETLELLRATIPVAIEINYRPYPDTLLLNADPTQIHQIIMNLVTNAYHAIGDTSGRIDIATTVVTLDHAAKVQYTDLPPGRYLQLIIADTGCGIKPGNLDRIFEPYFTTKEVDVGTGMGLATVHGIVQEHGGAIGVESRPGEGTSFFVKLPLTEMVTDAGSVDATELPTGNERILFVDDEKMLVESARDFLEELGYQASCETDPEEALARFAASPAAFDLVVTDLTMPSMTGAELVQEIKNLRPEIPVIVCSGLSKKLTDGNLADIGVACILNKPILFDDFARVVRTVLDERAPLDTHPASPCRKI